MSIAFPLEESDTTLDRLRARQDPDVTPVPSAARVEANRRNARKSTGPKTVRGKRRSSGNAMKHGLCRTLSCLPTECEATFLTFVEELREELRPTTAMQRLTFNQIVSLTWRLERLPEAQTKIFEQELGKVQAEDGESLSPSDVLARRFSEAPLGNGFALMERYERGMRSQLLRLIHQFEQLKKDRATTPNDPNEEFEARQAKYERQLRDDEERNQANRQRYAQEQAEKEAKAFPASPGVTDAMREVDGEPAKGPAGWTCEGEPARHTGPKQSQSKPSEKCDSEPPAGKCVVTDGLAVTERTHSTALIAEGASVVGGPVLRGPGEMASRGGGADPGSSGTLYGRI